ncbi:MAG: hypothetical protein E7334_09260 [Clostridiales bacterium]|nr:hypothetical protein [Clostridiales bacterium]
MQAVKSVSIKAVILLLAAVLLIGCTAGGTLAWMISKTAPVTNTFVAGDIGSLTLDESTGDSYIVTPGVDIVKDPVITFSGNNVDAYLFVEVQADGWEVSDDGMTYSIGSAREMSWEMDDRWTMLDSGVYYLEVFADENTLDADASDKHGIISGSRIRVSHTITKDTISSCTKDLGFIAYAIQKDGFDSVFEAWAQAKNASD